MSETAEQYRQRKLLENNLEILKLSIGTDSPEIIVGKNIIYGMSLFLLEKVGTDFEFFKRIKEKLAGWVFHLSENRMTLDFMVENLFNSGFREGYTHRQAEELTQLFLEEPIHRTSKN